MKTDNNKFIELLDSIIPQEQEKEEKFDISELNNYPLLKNIFFLLTILFYKKFKRLLFPKSSFKVSYYGFEIIYEEKKFYVDCRTDKEWKFLENVLLILWQENRNWSRMVTETSLWKNKHKSSKTVITPKEMIELINTSDDI